MIVRLDCARTEVYRRPRASNVCALASAPVQGDLLLAVALYTDMRVELALGSVLLSAVL